MATQLDTHTLDDFSGVGGVLALYNADEATFSALDVFCAIGGLLVVVQKASGDQTLSPSGIYPVGVLGVLTLAPGAVAVVPGGVVPLDAVGQVTLLPVATIAQLGIGPLLAFGTLALVGGFSAPVISVEQIASDIQVSWV